jgi:hypothetical protein
VITSISNFIRMVVSKRNGEASGPIGHGVVAAILACLAAVAVACGKQTPESSTGEAKKLSASPVKANSSQATSSTELLATLQKNFNQAIQGSSKDQVDMVEMPARNSAGIVCGPAVINGKRPSFRIVLPSRLEDRDAVLAAIVPDGSLRIIYIAYGRDVEKVDIIIPSNAIDWESAQKFTTFDVDARSFDALVPDANASSRLFEGAGVYQLALMSGFPNEIPSKGETPFRVTAGCVVHWSP